MQEIFKLTEGLSIENTDGVKSSYAKISDSELSCVLSAEKIKPVVLKAVSKIKKPYFFVEIPCTEEQQAKMSKKGEKGFHLQIFNLEVTDEVAEAILDRYGDLLINDGLTSFGFCSLETETEVYVMPFQNLTLYNENGTGDFERVMKEENIPEVSSDKLITLGSLISKNNPAERVMVEFNGETYFDMIENLKETGLTFAGITEDYYS